MTRTPSLPDFSDAFATVVKDSSNRESFVALMMAAFQDERTSPGDAAAVLSELFEKADPGNSDHRAALKDLWEALRTYWDGFPPGIKDRLFPVIEFYGERQKTAGVLQPNPR